MRKSPLRRRTCGAAFALLACAIVACGRPVALHGTRGDHAGRMSSHPTSKPAPPWRPSERAALRSTLGAILRDDVLARETGIVVLAEDGTPLFSRQAVRPITPASTLKLVVAATALDALGPSYRFATRFLALAPPDADGTIAGDLWFVGSGDPTLDSRNVRDGVGVLARLGVRRITGSLLIDDTAFSGPEQNPRWDPADLAYDYAAGTSAVALDGGVIEFEVTPGAPGTPAHVRPVPDNPAIVVSGEVQTGSPGSSTTVTIERRTGPTDSAVDASARDVLDDAPSYVVDGRIAPGAPQRYDKPILGMRAYAGATIAQMFAERGIAVPAGYRAGAAPLGATILWSHRSPPLADIVREMLVNSNNHTAETLLRVVGARNGRPGSDDSGIAFERRELARLGVRGDGMHVYDGSGLSPSDRITTTTLAELLVAQLRGPNADIFVRALPRVGLDGTVKHHQLHEALGRTRAKSGHIENVNGLAGEVQTRRHGRVAFAFVVNDGRANADVVTEEEDRALDALARS